MIIWELLAREQHKPTIRSRLLLLFNLILIATFILLYIYD